MCTRVSTFFAAVLAVASFALAGCAAEASSSDAQTLEQPSTAIDDSSSIERGLEADVEIEAPSTMLQNGKSSLPAHVRAMRVLGGTQGAVGGAELGHPRSFGDESDVGVTTRLFPRVGP